MRAFAGFNEQNPQHLAWLKRKLANRDRYQRRQAHRQPSGLKTIRLRLPRHLQSLPPAYSYWWGKMIAMQRNPLTGAPVLKTRLQWWTEAHDERAKEQRK